MSTSDHHFGAPAHLRQAQQRCGAIRSEYRAEPVPRPSLRLANPPAIDPALIPTEDQLRLRLAEELDYARRLLDSMGDALSTDLGLVMRHTIALQSIDIIGQLLGHIATVIRSSAPDRAVDRIGMSDLKARMTRKAL